MGIEKFFNSLKKTYGDKIITNLESKYPTKFLLLDFNSIIHNISQNISDTIINLYHLTLISNIKSDIFQINKIKIKILLDNLKTNFKISDNINLTDNTESDNSTYLQTIDFNELSIDNLNRAFFEVLMINNNLDNYIIHKVSTYIISLIDYLPNLQLLYLAIDGVPLFAKMIEQKKRRTIGYILEEIKSKLIEHYKKELDIDPNINNKSDIYYNQYQFELKKKNLKFNKSKISPGTQFMTNLELYITNYLIKHLPKIKIILDSYNKTGEGEKKIVYKIHELYDTKELLKTDSIFVYSPDADVILLMLLELDKCKIQIMRYDQQQYKLDIININELYKIMIDYMKYTNKSELIQHKIISDIVMLLTILGNDFLPKIEQINTNKHIKNILDSYLKLNINDTFIFEKEINWKLLKQFLINLKNNIHNFNNDFYRRPKNWTLLPDQIVNQNAIPYLTHYFNIENLTNIYEPKDIQQIYTYNIKYLCKKYLKGIKWLSLYYLEHNFDYKLFYYKYEIAPTIHQLIEYITKIINKNMIFKLEKLIPTKYFNPAIQLIYISPNNVSDIIDNKLLSNNQKLIDEYNETFNNDINININNNIINLFEYIDCNNALYLSKCHLKNSQNKIILKYLIK